MTPRWRDQNGKLVEQLAHGELEVLGADAAMSTVSQWIPTAVRRSLQPGFVIACCPGTVLAAGEHAAVAEGSEPLYPWKLTGDSVDEESGAVADAGFG
jgi:hypothetical protein